MKIKRQVKKMVAKFNGDTKTVDEMDDFQKWSERFEECYNAYALDMFDERELLYLGTHKTDKHIGNNSDVSSKDANNVRNITYEFIESQINTSLPEPSIKSKRDGWKFAAEMIQKYEKSLVNESKLPQINDENERTTPVQGFSFIEIMWDPDYEHHLHRGEIKYRKLHPKQFIPQIGVFDIDEMDYFFIVSSVTKPYVLKRYGVDLDNANEQYPEFNTLEYSAKYDSNKRSNTLHASKESMKVSEVVCYYKDENGDIGRYVFTENTVLEDIPNLYERKQKKCSDCGELYASAYEECPKCGSEKHTLVTLESETLDEDLYLTPIVYTKRYWEIGANEETGAKTATQSDRQFVQERIIPAGTEIPYYKPTRYPIIMRLNTPSEFSFGGQSDVDVLRDQQDAIKKLVSKAEETVLKGGSIVTMNEKLDWQPTNEVLKVVKGKPDELLGVKVHNIAADYSQNIELSKTMYDFAQSTIGISSSYQGKYDPSAKSGKAKQVQIEQSAGRLASKILNKFDSYKRLYEITFEFALAYYDETRPFISKTSDGKDDWGEFNKYEFLDYDKEGNLYYNTDFAWTTDAGNELPKDKVWLMEQIVAFMQMQVLTPIQVFELLESINFPMATEILDQMRKEKDEDAEDIKQAQMILDMIAAMTPEEREIFLTQTSPEDRMKMVSEVLSDEMS